MQNLINLNTITIEEVDELIKETKERLEALKSIKIKLINKKNSLKERDNYDERN